MAPSTSVRIVVSQGLSDHPRGHISATRRPAGGVPQVTRHRYDADEAAHRYEVFSSEAATTYCSAACGGGPPSRRTPYKYEGSAAHREPSQ